MDMNEEVRKAVEYCDRSAEDSPYDESDWYLVRAYLMQQDAELTRLTAIADSVDPLVVRLGEVTTRLEAANALLDRVVSSYCAPLALHDEILAHLSEPRT